MQPVARRVAHGIHPAVEIGEGRGIVEELIEDTVNGLGVRLWAYAAVVLTNGGEGYLGVSDISSRKQ